MFFPGGIFFLSLIFLSSLHITINNPASTESHKESSLLIVSLSLALSQELQRIHAYEVHSVFRWALRAWGEQSSLLLHPRGHPLLHYTQATNQRRWTHVLAVSCHCADPLTLTHIYSFSWCYWIQCILNIYLFLSLRLHCHSTCTASKSLDCLVPPFPFFFFF